MAFSVEIALRNHLKIRDQTPIRGEPFQEYTEL